MKSPALDSVGKRAGAFAAANYPMDAGDVMPRPGHQLHAPHFVLSLDKVSNRGTAMFVEVAKDVHLNLRYVVHYEVFDNGPYGRYARFHTVDGKVVDSDATAITVETIQSHMQGHVSSW